MRKKSPLIVFISLVLLLVFLQQIRLGALTGLFLWDVLDERNVHYPQRGVLAWVTVAPSAEQVEIDSAGKSIPADLYFLRDGKRHGAIVLTHGMIEEGKNDPRLVRFALSLARVGFVVLVPDLEGMKSLRILLSDVDDIVASFQYLRTLKDRVDASKIGLMGFSYGAGPTLIAGANPAIRDHVKFLVSFGGYYDPINVIRFITTGTYEYGRETGFLEPDPYGKWVFFLNDVGYLQNRRDQSLLRGFLQAAQKNEKVDGAKLLPQLSPQGKNLYQLLMNSDPNRFYLLVKEIDPKLREYLDKVSLIQVLPSIRAYLLIGHGSTDRLIPYTESLRLADAAKDRTKVHAAILRVIGHVDPARMSSSSVDFFTVYLPSMAQFYYFVYDLLNQQF